MAVTGYSLLTAIAVHGSICLVCFMLFANLRILKHTRKFFTPRRFRKDVEIKPKRLPPGFVLWIYHLWKYPEEEIIHTSGLDSAVLLRLLDYGLQFFMCSSLWCLLVVLPINATGNYVEFLQKLPNGTAITNIDEASMTNVKPGNDKLWAHTISVYVLTGLALKMLWRWCKDISALRVKYMALQPMSGASRTVLVTDIPGVQQGTLIERLHSLAHGTLLYILPKIVKDKIDAAFSATLGAAVGAVSMASTVATRMSERGTGPSRRNERQLVLSEGLLDPWNDAEAKLATGVPIQDLVGQEMRTVYGPQQLAAVNMVYNQRELEPLFHKYEIVKTTVEDLVEEYSRRVNARKTIKRRKMRVFPSMYGAWATSKYGFKSQKVDVLSFSCEELDHLVTRMDEVRNLVWRDHDYSPSAFVTFRNRYSQSVASTGLHSHDETMYRIQAAPGPDEVVWQNLRMRAWERSVRSLLLWGLFVMIIMFYMPVTVIIQTPVNINNLNKVAGVKELLKIPVVKEIIQGILPSIVLKVFLALLPPLLFFMGRMSGMLSTSEIDFSVVSKFFVFQLFATFIFQMISGSVLNRIDTLVKEFQNYAENPSRFINLMGESIPQTANFYMTYILLMGLTTQSIAFLRIVPLVLFLLFSRLATTERAKDRLWANQVQFFGADIANHSIVFLLGMVFSIINPVINPICMVYYVVANLVNRYNYIYVYTRPYDAQGRMWRIIFSQVMVALYFFQGTMICLLAIKKFKSFAVLIPVPICTFIFHMAVVQLFHRPWTLMSLKVATELDREETKRRTTQPGDPNGTLALSKLEQLYLSPVFKVTRDELAVLLKEVDMLERRMERMEAALGAGGGGDVEEITTPVNEEVLSEEEEGATPLSVMVNAKKKHDTAGVSSNPGADEVSIKASRP